MSEVPTQNERPIEEWTIVDSGVLDLESKGEGGQKSADVGDGDNDGDGDAAATGGGGGKGAA